MSKLSDEEIDLIAKKIIDEFHKRFMVFLDKLEAAISDSKKL